MNLKPNFDLDDVFLPDFASKRDAVTRIGGQTEIDFEASQERKADCKPISRMSMNCSGRALMQRI